MSTQRKIRRGTASENASFVGAEGEVVYLTDMKTIAVHDGSSLGGKVFDFSNSVASSGYQKLPSGLILQWGISAFTNGVANIAFPISFPNAIINCVASIDRGTALEGYLMSVQVGTKTRSSVAILGNYTSGGSVSLLSSNEEVAFFAIGN